MDEQVAQWVSTRVLIHGYSEPQWPSTLHIYPLIIPLTEHCRRFGYDVGAGFNQPTATASANDLLLYLSIPSSFYSLCAAAAWAANVNECLV